MQHLTPDLLVDYVHGELSPADDARAHAHLSACTTCRAEYDGQVAVGEILRLAATSEEREMPAFLKAAVWERVRAAEPGPLARLAALFDPALLRPALALPIAAILAIGAYVASPLAHHDPARTIAASYYLQSHAVQSAQAPLSERSNTQVYETSSGPGLVSDAFDSGYPATGALRGGR
ncbi:MAG: hypothetical protein NVS2B3_06570 [Vulcanimicrobiaceae bacterium]